MHPFFLPTIFFCPDCYVSPFVGAVSRHDLARLYEWKTVLGDKLRVNSIGRGLGAVAGSIRQLVTSRIHS